MVNLRNIFVSTDEIKKANRLKLLEALTDVTSELAYLLVCKETVEAISEVRPTDRGPDFNLLPSCWCEKVNQICGGLNDLRYILEAQISRENNK